MIRKKFTVRGMTCSSCSAHVEHSVSNLNGVASVQVNLMGATMHVEYDDAILSENDIINTVNSGGFVASIYEKNRAFNVENEKQEKKKFKKLVASIVLMIVLMYFSMGEMLNLPLPKIFENHKYIYRVIIPDDENRFPEDPDCTYPYSYQLVPTDELSRKEGSVS